MKVVEVPPIAGNLINSLRSIGDQIETAIADIIDNSLTAAASEINLKFEWNDGQCEIGITDNGKGMSESELIQAMTFASINSSEERNINDLGRFGLGLKSASLSQARILEVYSKKNNLLSSYAWNLNELEKANDGLWTLSQCTTPLKKINELLSSNTGTVVLWKDVDGIFSPGFGESAFFDLIDTIEHHLSLTFHRFIENGVVIRINEKPILPLNPFIANPSYFISPTENVGKNNYPIFIKAYLYMPSDNYHNNFDTCFIYRENRLLLSGGWFGIGVSKQLKSSPTKIAIEISNRSDKEWSIDIIKSKANLPITVKKQIEKYLKPLDKKLYKPIKKRKPKTFEDEGIWVRNNIEKNKFTINKSSIKLREFMDRIPEELKNSFKELISEIENTAPIKVEYSFSKEDKISESEENLTPEGRKEIRLHLLRLVKTKKLSIDLAKENVIKSGIFSGFESEIELIAQEIQG